MQPSPEEWRPGQRVGALETIERIAEGQGTYGVLHLVSTPTGDRQVLKSLNSDCRLKPDWIAKFRDETALHVRLSGFHASSHATAALRHSTRRISSWSTSSSGTLQTLIEDTEGDVKLSVAASILSDLCSALRAVHEAGFVYGDLSPLNVLLRAAGRRLRGQSDGLRRGAADGAARAPRGKQGARPRHSRREALDLSGGLLGPPPAQQRRVRRRHHRVLRRDKDCAVRPCGERADSAGAARHASCISIFTRTCPIHGALRPGLPVEVADLIMHCMAKCPDERPRAIAGRCGRSCPLHVGVRRQAGGARLGQEARDPRQMLWELCGGLRDTSAMALLCTDASWHAEVWLTCWRCKVPATERHRRRAADRPAPVSHLMSSARNNASTNSLPSGVKV